MTRHASHRSMWIIKQSRIEPSSALKTFIVFTALPDLLNSGRNGVTANGHKSCLQLVESLRGVWSYYLAVYSFRLYSVTPCRQHYIRSLNPVCWILDDPSSFRLFHFHQFPLPLPTSGCPNCPIAFKTNRGGKKNLFYVFT